MGSRVDELLSAMTIEEKAGALLVARVVVPEDGGLWEGREDQSPFGFVPTTELIAERHVTHLTVMSAPPVQALARWGHAVRALAAGTRLALPVSVASDPRHGRSGNDAVAQSGGGFSATVEPVGIAAADDPELTRAAAEMMARELRAAGVHLALHPMADLATEPRWARVAGTFGEDRDRVIRTVEAYVGGLAAGGVVATAKHFPGGGPQRGGEDAHFAEGAHTVYPGGRFEDHLAPFAAAVRAGVLRIMPGYAAPIGLEYDRVGFAFERRLITGLLRERLGFDGVVVTDFNVVTGMRLPRLGIELPVRAWGMLEATPVQRVARLLDAGVDQLGGEDDPRLVLDALDAGLVTEARIDESVRRVLREKERLGLLDDPAAGAVPAERIAAVVGTPQNRALARRVQSASVVVLAGDGPPLREGMRVYAEGVDTAALSGRAVVVADPADADIAVVRIAAPYEERDGLLAGAFHSGSLAFPAEEVARLRRIGAAAPLVLDVFLDRPAVLTEVAAAATVLTGTFGVDDAVLLDVLFGVVGAGGTLPFDLPRSMAAVEASREDVPGDTADPLFRLGHGLRWVPRGHG